MALNTYDACMKIQESSRQKKIVASDEHGHLPSFSFSLLAISFLLPIIDTFMEFLAVMAFFKNLPFSLLHSLAKPD